MKPILFKVILLLALPLSITSCALGVDMHGDWWNNNYAPDDEQWVHPTLNKQAADNVAVKCSDDAFKKAFSIKENLSNNEIMKIMKIMNDRKNHDKSIQSIVLQEQCQLDKGFKFYPRGIDNVHPTVCFGELKNRPGCQSAR